MQRFLQTFQRAVNSLGIITALGIQLRGRSMFDKTIRNTQAHDLRQIAVLAEERDDSFSHAAAQGSVLDGHHTTELTSDLVQQLLVERLGETQVVMTAIRSPSFRQRPRPISIAANGSSRQATPAPLPRG